LLPYIYDLAHEELPILRPLVIEFPNDPNCKELTDQFMLGDRILVAPVMTPGVFARAVYLPKGIWYDYYTGKRFVGGKYILADAPLDTIPLYVKAGSVIPVSAGDPQCTDDIHAVYLEAFSGNGDYLHYSDDGVSCAYKRGEYHCLKISIRGKIVTQNVIHDGFSADDKLNIVFLA